MPIINQIVKGGGGSAPAHYIEKAVDANGKLVGSSNIIDFTGVTDVGDYILYYAYYNNTAISGAVDVSDLTTISGTSACQFMFYGCTGLTSVDMSALTTVSGTNACQQMFQGCVGITSVNLSSLTTLSGSSACSTMFRGCTSLTTVDLSSLTMISGGNACNSMFRDCTSLATVRIGNTAAIDFGLTWTNQFTNMFNGCSQNIDVYAPAASQSAIEAFSGYPNFGATGTVTWHWNS